MVEYIDREGVRNALYDADAITMRGVKILNQYSAADVVEVRYCRFSLEEAWQRKSVYKCSACGATKQ